MPGYPIPFLILLRMKQVHVDLIFPLIDWPLLLAEKNNWKINEEEETDSEHDFRVYRLSKDFFFRFVALLLVLSSSLCVLRI